MASVILNWAGLYSIPISVLNPIIFLESELGSHTIQLYRKSGTKILVVSKQATDAILLERNPWKTTGLVYSNSLLAEMQANNPTRSNIDNL